MAPLSVADALFEKPYLWDRHGTYQSRPLKVIIKIRNQWYGIPERQPTSTVAMISARQMNKLIDHAQKFALIMIKSQHSKKITTMSWLTDQCSSRQQEQIENILEEYQNIFQAPDEVPLHCQVKHSIELVPSSSLPNTSIYIRSILENKEIHRQIHDLIDKGHIHPSSSPCGIPTILILTKMGLGECASTINISTRNR